jgi:signal transduction histidine kinase
MSVSRRVVVSIAVLMVLAFASLGYQVWVIRGMQRINEELASVNFRAEAELLQMTAQALIIESFTLKYFGLSDPDHRKIYADNLTGEIQAFSTRLRTLEEATASSEAAEEVSLLSTAWTNYRTELTASLDQPPGPDEDLPLPLKSKLSQLLLRIESSSVAVQHSTKNQVERNRDIGSQAEGFSMVAGIVFLLVGSAIAFLTLRSINRPLQELIHGTRSITSGTFSHRLPEDGPVEFAELARDFNNMTERLGELDQMKKDFVSHVSHELKAPLAAIRQTLAVTMEQIPGPINEQQRRLLQLSRNSAERLTAMVANLLDVSRLEAGTMDYEMSQQDLAELARTVVEEFSVRADERRINLTFAADPNPVPVLCDRDRMIQVVGNLVDNALKFAPSDSAIQVKLESQPSNNGSAAAVTLSVIDKGPGVPENHKHAVFEKFHQVKGGGKRAVGQGVGLGLAICKTIVDAHRGRIWVEDNPGGGSIFRMEIRAAAQKQETVQCG